MFVFENNNIVDVGSGFKVVSTHHGNDIMLCLLIDHPTEVGVSRSFDVPVASRDTPGTWQGWVSTVAAQVVFEITRSEDSVFAPPQPRKSHPILKPDRLTRRSSIV